MPSFPGRSRAPAGKPPVSRQDFELFHPFPACARSAQPLGSPTGLPHPIPQGLRFYLTSRLLTHCPQVPAAATTPGSLSQHRHRRATRAEFPCLLRRCFPPPLDGFLCSEICLQGITPLHLEKVSALPETAVVLISQPGSQEGEHVREAASLHQTTSVK